MSKGVMKSITSQCSKHYLFIALLLFGIQFVTSSTDATETVSVGVVNVTYLMENAPQSEIASAQLKNKFSPQELKLAKELEEINKLEQDLAEIKNDKSKIALKRELERELRSRKRLRSRSLQDFREELRFARDTALDDVQREVFKAIDEVRNQQNIDIILQDYVAASKRVDITQSVLKHLTKKLESSTQADNPNTQTK